MKATQALHNLGQSLWLDNITRDLLNNGTLKRYIDELSVTGLTSNPTIFDHTIKSTAAYDNAIRDGLAYRGPSLILAYCQCIAHGIDMRLGMKQQDLAVASGHWPLIRFNPELRSVSANPFQLDSPRPTIKLKEYAYNEMRYKSLAAMRPEEAAALAEMAQTVATERYRSYEELAQRDGSRFHPAAETVSQELVVDLSDSGTGLGRRTGNELRKGD